MIDLGNPRGWEIPASEIEPADECDTCGDPFGWLRRNGRALCLRCEPEVAR